VASSGSVKSDDYHCLNNLAVPVLEKHLNSDREFRENKSFQGTADMRLIFGHADCKSRDQYPPPTKLNGMASYKLAFLGTSKFPGAGLAQSV
jgi:hypothetical protein